MTFYIFRVFTSIFLDFHKFSIVFFHFQWFSMICIDLRSPDTLKRRLQAPDAFRKQTSRIPSVLRQIHSNQWLDTFRFQPDTSRFPPNTKYLQTHIKIPAPDIPSVSVFWDLRGPSARRRYSAAPHTFSLEAHRDARFLARMTKTRGSQHAWHKPRGFRHAWQKPRGFRHA